ncbi:ATP-binding protein [Phenylobacterium soli]|uniref:histidine kinase n=1 Tax=Phenylobacterium soli TaxID=2170551 RepID=A0A328AH06_9CAUL|nr:ATP-binding protein [Phenylobacterium soli]RAK53787.1 hybrid sensor histidine kinase/response regulator [Phenylobacterium soli]
MTQASAGSRPAPVATFHARVARVGLITTLVVLMAACATFMLQQWAVARAQSHSVLQSLTEMTARTAAPALARGDTAAAQAPLSAFAAVPRLVASQITDQHGRVVARYQAAKPADGDRDEVVRDVVQDGKVIGHVSITIARPTLAPTLPKYIALTLVLLFGGIGVALFLARSLAHQVIAPVQRLSEGMHKVAAGGSFEPVEVQADDELFRSLTASFNHLLGKLGEREDDLRRAMRELEEARDAANAANVLKTQFLANMSHEIRTPLNGVLAMAEVMAMGELDAVQRDRLDVIRQSGSLLLAVLNDVLDLSKIEAGKLTLVLDDFELGDAMAAAAEPFRVIASGKGLKFDFAVAENARGWWRADSDRLRQIVGNLLSNAVKFTPRGAVKARVDVSAETGALRIVVTDTGVGIAPEKLPTLFEKFTQADNSATRRFGGTGLGLAICRELTQMMGGSIDVESREGKGSTFTVELPLARGEPSEAVAEGADGRGEDGDLRLLAAEDNPTNQQVLQAVMDSLGIDIDIVPDGQEAVDAWRTGGYDLILMDIQMPVMDGIAAAREIRRLEQDGGRRRTPIVALTANALTHQIEEYLAAGMDGHVAKPIEIAKLYEAISAALNAAAVGAAGQASEPEASAA